MARRQWTWRRVVALVRTAPAWLAIVTATLILGTARAVTVIGLARGERGLSQFGLTLETIGWPALVGVLALVRRASTWHSGETLAGIYLLVGPLALCESAAWLRLPFQLALETLGPTMLLLVSFIILIWPSGAAAIWVVRRLNPRRHANQRGARCSNASSRDTRDRAI